MTKELPFQDLLDYLKVVGISSKEYMSMTMEERVDIAYAARDYYGIKTSRSKE